MAICMCDKSVTYGRKNQPTGTEVEGPGLLLVVGRLEHQLVVQELVLVAREAKLGETSALLYEGGFTVMTYNLL